jgi:hypothetical protein
MASRRWKNLSPRARKLLLAGAAGEGALKVVALVDLARRPTAQVRGPKPLWAVGLVVVNSVGLLPLAYFKYGRQV